MFYGDRTSYRAIFAGLVHVRDATKLLRGSIKLKVAFTITSTPRANRVDHPAYPQR